MAPQFFPPHATDVACGVQPQVLGMPPPPHVAGEAQLVGHVTCCPQLLKTDPQRAPFSQLCAAVSGRQPHTPPMPPPPQLSPVPGQVLAHWAVRPQLFRVGPHFAPAHVVDKGSSAHAVH
jgi:hypothetical protein